jgi:hypothetical protein
MLAIVGIGHYANNMTSVNLIYPRFILTLVYMELVFVVDRGARC